MRHCPDWFPGLRLSKQCLSVEARFQSHLSVLVQVECLAGSERLEVKHLHGSQNTSVPKERQRKCLTICLHRDRYIHFFRDKVRKLLDLVKRDLVLLVLVEPNTENMVRALKVLWTEFWMQFQNLVKNVLAPLAVSGDTGCDLAFELSRLVNGQFQVRGRVDDVNVFQLLQDLSDSWLDLLSFLDEGRLSFNDIPSEPFLEAMPRKDPRPHMLIENTTVSINVKLVTSRLQVLLTEYNTRFSQYRSQFANRDLAMSLGVILIVANV